MHELCLKPQTWIAQTQIPALREWTGRWGRSLCCLLPVIAPHFCYWIIPSHLLPLSPPCAGWIYPLAYEIKCGINSGRRTPWEKSWWGLLGCGHFLGQMIIFSFYGYTTFCLSIHHSVILFFGYLYNTAVNIRIHVFGWQVFSALLAVYLGLECYLRISVFQNNIHHSRPKQICPSRYHLSHLGISLTICFYNLIKHLPNFTFVWLFWQDIFCFWSSYAARVLPIAQVEWIFVILENSKNI